MAESTLPAAQATKTAARGLTWPMAWRNLWRNRRRTWLTAGGITFATLLVTMAMALQAGSYGSMIDNATALFNGHAEISRTDYIADSKLEQTIGGATEIIRTLSAMPGLVAAPRAQSFVLASVGERSFGGLIFGVDFAAEEQVVDFFDRVIEGGLPLESDEVLIGEVMARNLGANIGDEFVLLGTAKEGGIAALALRVSGIFRSGQVEFDRAFMFTHLTTVQNGFALGDEVHSIVLRFNEPDTVLAQSAAISSQMPPGVVARSWHETMPEVLQAIELDRVSGQIMYGMILILVTFSVVNTFLMIVFERTREFGMLLALGMRPWGIIRQIQLEALMIWFVGAALGLIASNLIVGYLANVGIPLAGMEELATQFYMDDRMYPAISLASLFTAPLVLLVGTQIAAFVATFRIRHLNPVTALRSE
jgi:putative ABC transport system permease protein